MSGFINLLLLHTCRDGYNGFIENNRIMGLITVPVFNLRHGFLLLCKKNCIMGSKFNYTPDSI